MARCIRFSFTTHGELSERHSCWKNFTNKAIAKHVPIQRLNTPYLNTISVEEQPAMPGDQDMERRDSCIDSLECLSNGTFARIKQVMI
ncbi:hypothetical protein ABVN80_20355 [Acinetobacter baumannii]